jgi:3-hydroxyacyl-CoA dehydrogenase/enoyl-CoA hydratase/3-hydroxybutyryl-CoA epimerase
VVTDAELLDAGVIFGTGFAPFRGGPIEYIKAIGRDAALNTLKSLESKYGARFAPKAGWDEL